MIGAKRVRNRKSLRPQILERHQPLPKQGSHGLVALQIDTADLAGPIVKIKVAIELVVFRCGCEFWRRSRLAVRRSWWHHACVPGLKFPKMLRHISRRSEQTFFFTCPQTNANRSPRLQP